MKLQTFFCPTGGTEQSERDILSGIQLGKMKLEKPMTWTEKFRVTYSTNMLAFLVCSWPMLYSAWKHYKQLNTWIYYVPTSLELTSPRKITVAVI